MGRAGVTFLVSLLAAGVLAAPEQPRTLPEGIDAPTLALYQRFLNEYKNPNSSDPALVTDLAAAKDGDLCFLHAVENCHDARSSAAFEQLSKLNTQRTFDIVAGRLKSESRWVREKAISLIRAFKRPETVTLLIDVLQHDPEPQNRGGAATVLRGFTDPRAEPALLAAARDENVSLVALPAADALGSLQSREGFKETVDLLEKTAGSGNHVRAVEALGTFRFKATIEILLDQYRQALPAEGRGGEYLRERIDFFLNQLGGVTFETLGPKPDTLEQWRDWWEKADPLLTDDLKFKAPRPKPRDWPAEKFGRNPDDLALTATVDAREYRLCDPIRLDLSFSNASQSPYAVVMPNLPSGWYPTMAYGVLLKRDGKAILNLAPSGNYVGSYSGAPGFETLQPGETFHSSVCLQHLLRPQVELPLAEGEYELTISFDPSTFPMIDPVGFQLVHEWKAKPVAFTVRGTARKDPAEILRLVGEKTGLKWLESDLTSPQRARRDRAWLAVFKYGDSRLTDLLAKIEKDHPDKRYPFLSSKDLEPFAWPQKKNVP